MNCALNTLIATLLLTGAANAIAASSVDLSVRGLITPSACEPSLSNGGVYDLGKVSAKDLKADQSTFLPAQTLQLSVTCDAATLMALEARDNRESSDYSNDISYYGLGMINDGEKLGRLSLRMLTPVADGAEARAIASVDGGTSWYVERAFMRDNILSVANTSSVVPLPLQRMDAGLYLVPEIAPTSGLTLNNEVAIDGSVTLTVRYL
ncbi:DUF1120 domain-containing protein [Pseudomonas cedrina subsp. fulgida]|nr:DUF1120 domain-containing protein [Pseudomonas cedrina subsp. fulgida]